MNELLGNGTSALLAFQRAIRTTSHNIANVNTEGYSRQRVLLDAAPPNRDGGGFDGNGVRVAGVERIASGFAAARVHETTAAHAREATHHELASRLDALFADGALDPSASFGDFFAALEDASLDPSSTTSRELALRSGEEVVARMRTLQGELDGTAREVDGRRRAGIERVNELSTGVAELNGRIVEHRAGGRQQLASDLLDQRDRLVGELSVLVDVETIGQDDGAMNVSIGDGIALVTGRRASPLRAVEDTTRPGRSDIEVGNGVTWQPVGVRLQGGELGGLEAFESDTLEPAMQRLGRLAQAFAAGVGRGARARRRARRFGGRRVVRGRRAGRELGGRQHGVGGARGEHRRRGPARRERLPPALRRRGVGDHAHERRHAHPPAPRCRRASMAWTSTSRAAPPPGTRSSCPPRAAPRAAFARR